MPERRSLVELVAGLWLLTLALLALGGPLLSLPDPLEIDLAVALSPPSPTHWLGTDELGRDLFSRLVAASRSTLIVSVGATGIALFLGTLVGLSAGLAGGLLDRGVRFMIDLLWSVPFVILVVLVMAVVGVSRVSLILAIGGIAWVSSARVVRAATAELRHSKFLLAAKAYGFGPAATVKLYLLPAIKPVLLALAAYGAVEVVTLETGLAFLSLSLPAPMPTWGGILAQGLQYFAAAPWIMAASAAVITTTLVSLQLLARRVEGPRMTG